MNKPDNTVIIGKTGSGKTVRALNLIADRDRVIIFDTLGHDYTDGVVFYDLAALKTFWATVYRGSFRLIYRPLQEQPEFEEICELAYKCGDLTLVAEELDIFAQPQRMTLAFQQMIKRGRHKDIRFIGITQRPFGIDRTITSQANHIFIFKTDEPRDVKYLCELLGDDIKEMLEGLEPYEYIECSDTGERRIGKDEVK